jgi:hypothetical protein
MGYQIHTTAISGGQYVDNIYFFHAFHSNCTTTAPKPREKYFPHRLIGNEA